MASHSDELKCVGYYTNWSQYRRDPATFVPEDIAPGLCTHLIYAFATLNGNRLEASEQNEESMYERFNNIKKKNGTIKTLLSVGGEKLGSDPFTQMVATDASRKKFAMTSVDFLRRNNFDGLDIDWEYPEDKHKFTLLVQTVRDEFVKEAKETGNERLLLTAAVSAGKDQIDKSYEIPEISSHLDFINLMTYDFHGSWENYTGHNSPLYGRDGENDNNDRLNLAWASQYWVQQGAPKEKLIIGVPLGARTFRLRNATNNGVGAEAGSPGQAGEYTKTPGVLAYYEVCQLLQNGGQSYDIRNQKVPYMVKGDLWAGYTDPKSMRDKVDYIRRNRFGGVMVWALDLDDFRGRYGQGRYPLMNAILR